MSDSDNPTQERLPPIQSYRVVPAPEYPETFNEFYIEQARFICTHTKDLNEKKPWPAILDVHSFDYESNTILPETKQRVSISDINDKMDEYPALKNIFGITMFLMGLLISERFIEEDIAYRIELGEDTDDLLAKLDIIRGQLSGYVEPTPTPTPTPV